MTEEITSDAPEEIGQGAIDTAAMELTHFERELAEAVRDQVEAQEAVNILQRLLELFPTVLDTWELLRKHSLRRGRIAIPAIAPFMVLDRLSEINVNDKAAARKRLESARTWLHSAETNPAEAEFFAEEEARLHALERAAQRPTLTVPEQWVGQTPPPPGWIDPEPLEGRTYSFMLELSDGSLFEGEACNLCEWCCRRAEFHEMNHDLYLCARCTFEVAPTRPLVTVTPARANRTDDTPEAHLYRMGYHLIELLLASQGGSLGYASGEDFNELASGMTANEWFRACIGELGELTFSPGPFSEGGHLYDVGWNGYSPSQELYFWTRLQPLRIAGSPYANAVICLCQAAETEDLKEAQGWLSRAVEWTAKHITQPQTPATPIATEGASHAEPVVTRTQPKAKPPRRQRRRVRGD